jgi:hypothetical protein
LNETTGVVSVVDKLCDFAKRTHEWMRRYPQFDLRVTLVKEQFQALIPVFDGNLLKHWLIFADPPFPLSMFSIRYCMARDFVSAPDLFE